MIGIGIETSCDETSAAVIEDGRKLRSCVIYSQIEEHRKFGGVVPEIASRSHLVRINGIFKKALEDAGVEATDLSYAAVTSRPGLTGSLMVGGMLAKCLQLVHGIPIVTIDHLEAHLYASLVHGGAAGEASLDRLSYPFLGLLLSGGNSAIFIVHGPGRMEQIADTADDALGEAFDKSAAILGLGYPGGPLVEKAAENAAPGDPIFHKLLRDETGLLFSFSGIKTAVIRAKEKGCAPEAICRDFQDTVFELVERMVLRAANQTGIRRVVASGGVLANGALRRRLDALKARQIEISYPASKMMCTDNGAMVASLGYFLFSAGVRDLVDFRVSDKRV
jgi:N6-L-threonylcarbamoyladenine synthase